MVTSCHFLSWGFILFTMVRNTGHRIYKTGLDTDQWTWILSRLPLQHGGERETSVCNTVSVIGQWGRMWAYCHKPFFALKH